MEVKRKYICAFSQGGLTINPVCSKPFNTLKEAQEYGKKTVDLLDSGENRIDVLRHRWNVYEVTDTIEPMDVTYMRRSYPPLPESASRRDGQRNNNTTIEHYVILGNPHTFKPTAGLEATSFRLSNKVYGGVAVWVVGRDRVECEQRIALTLLNSEKSYCLTMDSFMEWARKEEERRRLEELAMVALDPLQQMPIQEEAPLIPTLEDIRREALANLTAQQLSSWRSMTYTQTIDRGRPITGQWYANPIAADPVEDRIAELEGITEEVVRDGQPDSEE